MEQILRQNKKLVCFGAGALAEFMLASYDQLRDGREVVFIDNDNAKDGTYIGTGGRQFPVYSVEHFKLMSAGEDFLLLIVPVFFVAIIEQLDADRFFDGTEAYIYLHATSQVMNPCNYPLRSTEQPLIPKVLHYCWFGHGKIPDTLQRIMESWKRFCPDYEIIRWDESNYDVKKNAYIGGAYDRKQYAYVSDYARKDVLYEYGGIYLDTDVEIVRNIDELRYNHAFVGMDDAANIGSGAGMGAVAGMPVMKELRDDYEQIAFVRQDGSLNRDASGVNETRKLMKSGYRQTGTYQQVAQLSIFPREVLLPVSWCGFPDLFTENTYMVHRFQKFVYGYRTDRVEELREKVNRLLGRMDE